NLAYLNQQDGAVYKFYSEVTALERKDGAYRLELQTGEVITAGRVCVAAGVGSRAIFRHLGLDLPVNPSRGQMVISERLPATVNHIFGGGSIHQFTQPGVLMMGLATNELGVDENVNTYAGLQHVIGA